MTLKELLIKNDIRGAQLARKIDYERTTVSRWVTGKANPPITLVPRLAEILNCSVEDIVGCFVKKDTEL